MVMARGVVRMDTVPVLKVCVPPCGGGPIPRSRRVVCNLVCNRGARCQEGRQALTCRITHVVLFRFRTIVNERPTSLHLRPRNRLGSHGAQRQTPSTRPW